LLSLIDDLKTQIDKKKFLQKEHWSAIQEKLRIDWTYDSNAIEGTSLTRGETLFFLREGLTVEGKPLKDFLDARNHAEAIDWLYEVIKDNRSVSQRLIKEMNALLLSGVKYTLAINQSGQKVRKKLISENTKLCLIMFYKQMEPFIFIPIQFMWQMKWKSCADGLMKIL